MEKSNHPGPLATYNSLRDEHLIDYFSNPRKLQHLRRMHLITAEGLIVGEELVRKKVAEEDLKEYADKLLAKAIVAKSVEIERRHRAEVKRKLEFLAKLETVEKIKSERRLPNGVQDFNPFDLDAALNRNPSMVLDLHKGRIKVRKDQVTDLKDLLALSLKSKTIAPLAAASGVGATKMQATVQSPYLEDPRCPYLGTMDTSKLVPQPPTSPVPETTEIGSRKCAVVKKPEVTTFQSTKQTKLGLVLDRGPNTSPLRPHHLKTFVHITLRYVGLNLCLDGGASGALSEVTVIQQHCGGNTVTLFKGKVAPKEDFTFYSRRHIGMPFGLAIYIDGIVHLRISTCCEYRHTIGALLGGGKPCSLFQLINLEDGKPCYKCQARMEKGKKKETKPLQEEDSQEELDKVLEDNLDIAPPTDLPSQMAVRPKVFGLYPMDLTYLLRSEVSPPVNSTDRFLDSRALTPNSKSTKFLYEPVPPPPEAPEPKKPPLPTRKVTLKPTPPPPKEELSDSSPTPSSMWENRKLNFRPFSAHYSSPRGHTIPIRTSETSPSISLISCDENDTSISLSKPPPPRPPPTTKKPVRTPPKSSSPVKKQPVKPPTPTKARAPPRPKSSIRKPRPATGPALNPFGFAMRRTSPYAIPSRKPKTAVKFSDPDIPPSESTPTPPPPPVEEERVPTPEEERVPTPEEERVPTPEEERVPTPEEERVPTPEETYTEVKEEEPPVNDTGYSPAAELEPQVETDDEGALPVIEQSVPVEEFRRSFTVWAHGSNRGLYKIEKKWSPQNIPDLKDKLSDAGYEVPPTPSTSEEATEKSSDTEESQPVSKKGSQKTSITSQHKSSVGSSVKLTSSESEQKSLKNVDHHKSSSTKLVSSGSEQKSLNASSVNVLKTSEQSSLKQVISESEQKSSGISDVDEVLSAKPSGTSEVSSEKQKSSFSQKLSRKWRSKKSKVSNASESDQKSSGSSTVDVREVSEVSSEKLKVSEVSVSQKSSTNSLKAKDVSVSQKSSKSSKKSKKTVSVSDTSESDQKSSKTDGRKARKSKTKLSDGSVSGLKSSGNSSVNVHESVQQKASQDSVPPIETAPTEETLSSGYPAKEFTDVSDAGESVKKSDLNTELKGTSKFSVSSTGPVRKKSDLLTPADSFSGPESDASSAHSGRSLSKAKIAKKLSELTSSKRNSSVGKPQSAPLCKDYDNPKVFPPRRNKRRKSSRRSGQRSKGSLVKRSSTEKKSVDEKIMTSTDETSPTDEDGTPKQKTQDDDVEAEPPEGAEVGSPKQDTDSPAMNLSEANIAKEAADSAVMEKGGKTEIVAVHIESPSSVKKVDVEGNQTNSSKESVKDSKADLPQEAADSPAVEDSGADNSPVLNESLADTSKDQDTEPSAVSNSEASPKEVATKSSEAEDPDSPAMGDGQVAKIDADSSAAKEGEADPKQEIGVDTKNQEAEVSTPTNTADSSALFKHSAEAEIPVEGDIQVPDSPAAVVTSSHTRFQTSYVVQTFASSMKQTADSLTGEHAGDEVDTAGKTEQASDHSEDTNETPADKVGEMETPETKLRDTDQPVGKAEEVDEATDETGEDADSPAEVELPDSKNADVDVPEIKAVEKAAEEEESTDTKEPTDTIPEEPVKALVSDDKITNASSSLEREDKLSEKPEELSSDNAEDAVDKRPDAGPLGTELSADKAKEDEVLEDKTASPVLSPAASPPSLMGPSPPGKLPPAGSPLSSPVVSPAGSPPSSSMAAALPTVIPGSPLSSTGLSPAGNVPPALSAGSPPLSSVLSPAGSPPSSLGLSPAGNALPAGSVPSILSPVGSPPSGQNVPSTLPAGSPPLSPIPSPSGSPPSSSAPKNVPPPTLPAGSPPLSPIPSPPGSPPLGLKNVAPLSPIPSTSGSPQSSSPKDLVPIPSASESPQSSSPKNVVPILSTSGSPQSSSPKDVVPISSTSGSPQSSPPKNVVPLSLIPSPPGSPPLGLKNVAPLSPIPSTSGSPQSSSPKDVVPPQSSSPKNVVPLSPIPSTSGSPSSSSPKDVPPTLPVKSPPLSPIPSPAGSTPSSTIAENVPAGLPTAESDGLAAASTSIATIATKESKGEVASGESKGEVELRSTASKVSKEEVEVRSTASKVSREEEIEVRSTAAKVSREEVEVRSMASKVSREEEVEVHSTASKVSKVELRSMAAEVSREEVEVRSTASKVSREVEVELRSMAAEVSREEVELRSTASKVSTNAAENPDISGESNEGASQPLPIESIEPPKDTQKLVKEPGEKIETEDETITELNSSSEFGKQELMIGQSTTENSRVEGEPLDSSSDHNNR